VALLHTQPAGAWAAVLLTLPRAGARRHDSLHGHASKTGAARCTRLGAEFTCAWHEQAHPNQTVAHRELARIRKSFWTDIPFIFSRLRADHSDRKWRHRAMRWMDYFLSKQSYSWSIMTEELPITDEAMFPRSLSPPARMCGIFPRRFPHGE